MTVASDGSVRAAAVCSAARRLVGDEPERGVGDGVSALASSRTEIMELRGCEGVRQSRGVVCDQRKVKAPRSAPTSASEVASVTVVGAERQQLALVQSTSPLVQAPCDVRCADT